MTLTHDLAVGAEPLLKSESVRLHWSVKACHTPKTPTVVFLVLKYPGILTF